MFSEALIMDILKTQKERRELCEKLNEDGMDMVVWKNDILLREKEWIEVIKLIEKFVGENMKKCSE